MSYKESWEHHKHHSAHFWSPYSIYGTATITANNTGVEPISRWNAVSGLEVMENMQKLTNLQELWLGRNRIKSINLCGLKCIKKLSLQSNRLTSMKGLEGCTSLEELYLSHNGIAKMEGLSTLVKLRVLDVSSNKLAAIEDIEKLTCLEDLWFNDNQLASLDGISEAVSGFIEKLTTIYLEHNPCVMMNIIREDHYALRIRPVA